MTSEDRPGRAWYLLPILLGIIGGFIAYYKLHDRNRQMAKRCLKLGIVIVVAGYGIPMLILVIAALIESPN